MHDLVKGKQKTMFAAEKNLFKVDIKVTRVLPIGFAHC